MLLNIVFAALAIALGIWLLGLAGLVFDILGWIVIIAAVVWILSTLFPQLRR